MDEIYMYLSVYELSPSVHDNHRDGWDVWMTVDEIYSIAKRYGVLFECGQDLAEFGLL